MSGRLLLVVVLIALALPSAAAAEPPAFPTDGCATYGPDEQTVCTAQVPSFDGTPLDVDVTLPLAGEGGSHPLIVLLHGFAADKHDWQSVDDEGDQRDKHHWNSHWFARRGFYVLTYTARGFRTDPPSEPYQPATPSGTSASLPGGTIQLKSRTAEIRDTQYLAALLAATFPDLDRDRVAVSGNSYGGGESWLQAADAVWDSHPGLPALRLRVAVPKYSWIDLAYGLAPNGRASTGRPEDPLGRGFPIGVVKDSYVNGFFALGAGDGIFENGTRSAASAGAEGPISIQAWRDRLVDVGDPYDVAGVEDPIVAQARRGLTEFRGSFYQDEQFAAQAASGEQVAIFGIQGWTDDLFTAVEAFRQYERLKALDPGWPIALALGDVGHPRAQNRPETWRWLNSEANAFLRANLNDSEGAQSYVASERTECGDRAPQQRVHARTPDGLANGAFTADLPGGALTSAGGAGDPDGVAADPIAGPLADQILFGAGECRRSVSPEFPGRYTARTAPLEQAETYLGEGEVRLPYVLSGGPTATVLARLWDEAPDGEALLIDRGVYRLDLPAYDTPAGALQLPLFGNDWKFERGHRIRLDLVQVDEPSYRRANPPSAFTFSAARLVLPTLETAP